MNARDLIETLETLTTNPNNGEITFHVEPVKEIIAILKDQEAQLKELHKFLNETRQTGTFIVWRDSQYLAEYQQQAAELWNDSCTSNRGKT